MSYPNELDGWQPKDLWAAVSTKSELSCEQVELLLPLIAQAEAVGEDAYNYPSFRTIFHHFDGCEECATLYAQISDDLGAVLGGPSKPLVVMPAARPFFPSKIKPTKEYKSVAWSLHVWNDAVRSLKLVTQPLTLTPKLGVLGKTENNWPIFCDRVPDLKDKPIFSVTILRQDEQTLVRVVLRDIRATTAWQVQLASGGQVWEQQTDERGVADFAEMPLDSIAVGMTITCRELPG